MRNLVVLLIIGISRACGQLRSSIDSESLSSNCGDTSFKHKSGTELTAMSPPDRMDQMVLELMFHSPLEDDNHQTLHSLIIEDGVKILPKASEYANGYDPNSRECKTRNEARLLASANFMNVVDSAKFRLRAIEEGRLAIDALERAIERKTRKNLLA